MSSNDDKVLEIDNLILKTYLADVSTGASSRNVGKISFQDQVVYFENFIIVLCLLQQLRNQSLYFMSSLIGFCPGWSE